MILTKLIFVKCGHRCQDSEHMWYLFQHLEFKTNSDWTPPTLNLVLTILKECIKTKIILKFGEILLGENWENCLLLFKFKARGADAEDDQQGGAILVENFRWENWVGYLWWELIGGKILMGYFRWEIFIWRFLVRNSTSSFRTLHASHVYGPSWI